MREKASELPEEQFEISEGLSEMPEEQIYNK